MPKARTSSRSGRSSTKTRPARAPRTRRARLDAEAVVKQIDGSARSIHQGIRKRRKPSMKFPLRSLSNVRYSARRGHFEMLGKHKERTLTVSTAKTFAQTLRMIALSKQLIQTDDRATKRDVYYQTKNWGDARCDEQVESDTLMDDIEAHYGINKEKLHFTPDEHGGLVAGELVVIDREMGTGRALEIDCTKFGSGSYGVPIEVEELGFRTKAKFILAIETRMQSAVSQNRCLLSRSKIPPVSIARMNLALVLKPSSSTSIGTP